ncbi:hypothetical protein GOQ30_10095 [Flavobacterium sp. TP390]|uniref:Uncharacterized protein n=1 Tax=Flavobacterium profundi TaxID=1774945 RepID=A0A6I4IIP9_9FLAO|nr:hypothetical protein [Flavobacterium profundi]MVO09508.1 hypothetical protein [Flavobacterium profundi]
MRKGTFILILSLFFINCKEKTKTIDKTYEQLEAEVLCDVLPDIIKDYYKKQPVFLPPPYETHSKIISKKELDSINTVNAKEWLRTNNEIQKYRSNFIKLIPQHKKVTFGIVASLRGISSDEIKGTENYFFPLYDSLGTRAVYNSDFLSCSVNIKTIPVDSIFEGEVRNNTSLAVISLSRVLIDKPQENAYLEVFDYFNRKKVFCFYSNKQKEWVIKEIIKE